MQLPLLIVVLHIVIEYIYDHEMNYMSIIGEFLKRAVSLMREMPSSPRCSLNLEPWVAGLAGENVDLELAPHGDGIIVESTEKESAI